MGQAIEGGDKTQSDMTLLYDSGLPGGEAATHVFIVGVDDYPWIDQAFPGAQSLTGCCRSAELFFEWATTRFRNRRAPLGTVRVLLSPGSSENSGMSTKARAAPATRESFYQDAIGWAECLSANRNNIGIFLFSGQGFGLGFDRRVLALSDAGQSGFAPFQGCVSFDNLYAGLAPSARAPEMARQQYFFLDTGSEGARVPDFLERNASHIFAIPDLTMADNRVAPVFSAAAPGGAAFGRRDGVTFFVEALMRSLDGSGAETGDSQLGYNGGEWVVTARSLARGLEAEARRFQLEHEFIQFSASGLIGSSVLHELQKRPTVLIRVDFSGRSENELELRFKELPDGKEHAVLLKGGNRNLDTELPAGVYTATMLAKGIPVRDPILVVALPPELAIQL